MMMRIIVLAILLSASCAWADEDAAVMDSQENEAVVAGQVNSGEVGADASRADKRLPPVFPGEEVQDGQNKIKVWSTTGQVADGQVPQAPNLNTDGSQVIGGVIVDMDGNGRGRNNRR